MQKHTYLNLNNLKLVGILQKPKKPSTHCIILTHGLGTDKDENGTYITLAETLSKKFHTFRFDFQAHGESEGKQQSLTIKREINDILSTINYLKTLNYKTFSIIASSFSGAPTLYLIKKYPIKSLILWNALIDYKTIKNPKTDEQKKRFSKNNLFQVLKQGYMPFGRNNFKIGLKLIIDIYTKRPYKILKELKIPTLLIHGNKDTLVPMEDTLKHLKNNEFKIIKNATHGFRKHKVLASKIALDFLNKQANLKF